MDTPQEKATPPLDSKLDAIKEIIFGEQIKEYNAEFNKVDSEIAQLKNNLEAQINTLEQSWNQKLLEQQKNFDNQLASLKTDTLKAIEKLDDNKLDKKVFIELFQNVVKGVK